MNNRSVGKYLLTACLLASGIIAAPVLADWSVPVQQQGYKRQGFGDFPPKDIDKLLMSENVKANDMQAESKQSQDQAKENQSKGSLPAAGQQPVSNATGTVNNYQPDAAQNPAAQNNLTPNYGNYPAAQNNLMPNYGNYPAANYGNYYGPRGGTPWNNGGSGFTSPWNNRGSSFTTPWGNNNGSGFSGPWNNNGSSFTGPWNNNGSSFGPFGN